MEGGYQMAAGTALPPLVVDDEEAVALAVGLQAAAHSAVEGIAESSVRALAKVVQVMPARLRRRVEALGAITVPAGWGDAGGDAEAADPASSPRSRWPAVTPNGSASPTPRPAASRPTGTSSRTGWSCSAAAGTWSATTWPGTTGAASASTGSPRRTPPGPGSGPASYPPPTPPPSSGPASQTATAVYEVQALVDAPAADVRERFARWATVEDITPPAA